jgi:hypothetical protein
MISSFCSHSFFPGFFIENSATRLTCQPAGQDSVGYGQYMNDTFCSRSFVPFHSGTGLIYEMVLVKKLTLEAAGHECRMQFS